MFRQAIKSTITGVIRLLTLPLGAGGRRRFLRLLCQGMDTRGLIEADVTVQTARGDIRLICPGDLPLWRAETFLTKEPETIEWINAMDDEDVLYDIGANIGLYTLYAAINRKTRVLAFEPLASNYYLLNLNIEENNLAETVSAYCLACNNEDMLSKFHAQDTAFGSALSSFDTPIEQHGQTHASDFEQGMLGVSLDGFIEKYDPPFPTHIKIDVDGIEDKVIAGGAQTLADPRLKSVQVELDSLNTEYTARVTEMFETAGLKLTAKRRAPMFDDSPVEHMYNYQFHR